MPQQPPQPASLAHNVELIGSVIERLATLPRLPTSTGERQAAFMIRDNLASFGCRVAVEEIPAYSSYAWPIGLMCAAGAGLAALGIADDVSGGRMVFRGLFLRPRTAHNVVAVTGDLSAARTLVVLAHHDAAPSGFVFRQSAQHWLA